MKEVLKYQCSKCGDLFDNEIYAQKHESGHLKAIKLTGEFYQIGTHHLRIPDRINITFIDQDGYEHDADYELNFYGHLSFFQKICNAFAGLFRKEKFYKSEKIDDLDGDGKLNEI